MIITAIEPHGRKPGRSDIYADGHLLMTVADDVVARLHLKAGQDVDEDRLREISEAADLQRATDIALRYLETRPRTRREIETRLRRDAFGPPTIEAVVAKLRRLGLIDDADFAGRYVEHKARPTSSRPVGRRRLAAELMKKGVDRDVVDEAVGAVDDDRETELARAAADARLKQIPDDPEERQAARRRLAAYLARRGFSWTTIEPILRDMFKDD